MNTEFSTLLEREGDGRFHNKNINWANSMAVPKMVRNYEFALRSHSCIVDGLAGQMQDMYAMMEQIQAEQEQEIAPEQEINLNM